MQVNQTTLENVIDIIETEGYNNVKMFLQSFGKTEFTILNFTGDNTPEEAKDIVLKRVHSYPNGAEFKIVLSQSKTANASTVLVFFFSTKEQNQPTPQPQPQAQNVGLGGVEQIGLGAIEVERKRSQLEMQAMEDKFRILLEEKSLKEQKQKLRDEKRAFEEQQKFAIAKKFGEGLGAAAISFASQHPALAGLLGQLGAVAPAGLGAASEDNEDEYMTDKEELLDEINESDMTAEEIQEALQLYHQIKNSKSGETIQQEEEIDEY